MIVQQINLYQERFRAKRLWISAAQVAVALVIVIAAVAIWSFLLQSQVNSLAQRNQALTAERERMIAELTVSNAELARQLEDKRLDLEIEDVARQISARKKVLNFVDSNRFGSGEGFSEYLVALSRLRVDEIWLSQIHLAENYVQLRGSALDASEIPVYFDRFGSERVFQGNRFDLFRLTRDKDYDWKVDFEIATTGEFDE